MDKLRVHEVCIRRHEHRDETKSKDTGAQDGDDPVRVGLGRPSIPEQSDRDCPAAVHHGRKTGFGSEAASRCVGDCDMIGDTSTDYQAQQASNTETEICQASHALGEPVVVFENTRDCRKHEVEVAVGDGCEERKKKHDGRAEEKLDRSCEGGKKEFSRRSVAVVDGSQLLVSCLFSKSLGFASEKNRRIGFTVAEDGADNNNPSLDPLASQKV